MVSNKFLKWIIILSICFLGFYLRQLNYTTIPKPGESLDEYANAWSGLGLISLGTPIGWSFIENDHYQPIFRYINVDNIYQIGTANANPFYLHLPWLDHPPGLGLISGGFAYLKGARVLEDFTVVLIRKPFIYLGTINIFLLFIIGLLYFNFSTGLIAAIIYAVSPLIVISSHMPQSENGFTPLFLLSVIFIKLFQNTSKSHQSLKSLYFIFSALTAGLGIWFKIPAVLITVTVFLLILFSSTSKPTINLKIAFLFSLLSLSFGLLPLLAYGLALNPTVFFKIIFFHSQRFYGIGVSALYQLFLSSKITKLVSLTDGWLLLGWLSFFILLLKEKFKNLVVTVPIFVCLIFFIFMGSEFYGWYIFPFFPWLVLAISVTINQINQRNNLVLPSLLITLPAQILINKIDLFTHLSNFINYWRFGFTLYLGFLLSTYLFNHPTLIKIQKILIYFWLFLAIFLSIYFIIHLNPGSWFSVN